MNNSLPNAGKTVAAGAAAVLVPWIAAKYAGQPKIEFEPGPGAVATWPSTVRAVALPTAVAGGALAYGLSRGWRDPYGKGLVVGGSIALSVSAFLAAFLRSAWR